MPLLSVNGTELFYEDTGGDGPAVLFSHGLLWSHRMFAPQVAVLRDRFRCVSYDHRGQGDSAKPRLHSIGMDLLTDDAVALIGALGLGSVHFVGLSMGGFVGLRLAARHPELVRSLSLLETAADPEPRENIPKYGRLNIVARLGGLRFVARQVLPIMFGPTFLNDPKRASARETWKNELLRNRRTIYRAVNGVLDRDSVEDLLPTIKAPTLVVHSAEDTAIKRPRMEALAAGIAGSRLELLPRGGHTATIEEPELMNQVLVRFLDGLPS